MISKDYKQNKKQVLDLYDEYVKICELAKIEVDKSIKMQARKIKEEVFNLMVLGEAKSGKSTFINAYLGKEVVPMDVRQCTSAIIKIKKGDRFELLAKTAGGGLKIVTGYDEIKNFLKKHASIPDKYRNIPITSINNELLITYRDKDIPSKIMKLHLDKYAKDNIFNIDINEYNKLIKQYIKEKKPEWRKIITEMEITFQLPEEMQGITIIDSPGVGAGGNVGKIAEEYIADANAIIFVKSLNGQALESLPFMNFLRNNCTNRKKESLFLVLTRKSTLPKKDFERLKEQTIEMYKNDIEEEKILFVDSKMQLLLNECKSLGTEEKIDAFFNELDAQGDGFAPASLAWIKSRGDVSKFNEKMEEESNFNSVQVAIEKFARGANYLQLIQFLDSLSKEYKHYKEIFLDALNVAKDNIKDPDALEDKINEKKNEIADVFNKMKYVIHEIFNRYTDNISYEAIIPAESDKFITKYENELENFKKISASDIDDQTFSALKKMTLDAIDDSKEFRDEIAKQFLKECNEELIQYTDDPTKIPAEAYVPNFTEVDFDKINNYAREKTSGYEDIEHGITFKSAERVPYHNLKEHVKIVVNSISNRLNEIISTMMDNIINYVTICRDVYMDKLDNRKKSLETEYQKLLNDKDDNEKLLANIEELKNKIDSIESELIKLEKLKGDLKNYVG